MPANFAGRWQPPWLATSASIINIGLMSGVISLSRAFIYAMSKSAVHNISRHLALGWATQNIRMNNVVPGFFPAQTIAPKFTGRFNKGVDYVGDVRQFEKEFNNDLATIAFAISEFGLPDNLKLSIHSGSDKFSIYGPIRDALRRTGAGVHVKTAGTTWLEELIGLAEAGGEGLEITWKVYAQSLEHKHALCKPHSAVIDIDESRLPTADTVNGWAGEQYARALRHNQSDPIYNPHLRQLLHVGYKFAAQMGERYYAALGDFESDVSRNVTENPWMRHIKPLFID